MNIGLDEVLRAAADHTRLRILNLLRQGGVCVCDLQQVLSLPQPTVSRHLAVLRHAGLVSDTRSGNRVMYALAPGGSTRLQAFFEFLEKTVGQEEGMKEDSRRLESLLRGGECAGGGIRDTLERIAS